MTGASARTTANLVLAALGAAAAYVVITTPPLRRAAARAVKVWLGASVPAYLMEEAGRAWIESGRTG